MLSLHIESSNGFDSGRPKNLLGLNIHKKPGFSSQVSYHSYALENYTKCVIPGICEGCKSKHNQLVLTRLDFFLIINQNYVDMELKALTSQTLL